VLFTVREENISIPRISEMIEYESKWYKVRQVYYTYHNVGNGMCAVIEVNLERSDFE
jgi:hypothetical protein